MVSDLLIGGLTVLGGAISGIIGVLYSEFQSRRERQKNLKEWYNTTSLLAERVERLASEDLDASGEYIADGFSGVLDRLTSHLMDAPKGADRGVVNTGEELAAECERARQFIRGDRMRNAANENVDSTNPLESVSEKAESVQEVAESASKEVNWL